MPVRRYSLAQRSQREAAVAFGATMACGILADTRLRVAPLGKATGVNYRDALPFNMIDFGLDKETHKGP